MTGIFSRLIRQSGIYALSNIALKVSGLVLAVVYLDPDYLTIEEFGNFSLLIVTAQFGICVTGLGLGTGLLKFMTDPDYREQHQALPFTTLIATLGAAGTAWLVFGLMAEPVATLMLDSPARATLIHLMVLYTVLKVVGGIPLMLLRVQEHAGWYAIAVVAEVLVILGGVYLLMVELQQGLAGLMGAYTVAAGVSTTVLVAVMIARVPWRFERRLVRPLIRFGYPLVVASLAGLFLNAGDRYLLRWLADTAAVGLYEWGARLAGTVNMLFAQSFNLAFAVIGLKTLGAKMSDGYIHRRTLHHYLIWTGWAVLGLSLGAYDLTVALPADEAYLQADALVLILSLGFMNYGIYYVIINVVYAAGRSKAISLNVMGAAAVNLVLNLVLIPYIGVFGAALSTYLAYLALALGAAYFAQQDAKASVGFPWGVYIAVIGLVGVLYTLGLPSLAWSTLARLGVRAGLILAYPLLIVATGLYVQADLRVFWKSVSRWLQQRPPDDSTLPP